MFKRIDAEEIKISGYSYKNSNGGLDSVSVLDDNKLCRIRTVQGDDEYIAQVCHADIPKLITALQAVYDHKEA